MKYGFVCLTAVALLAGGMIHAQSSQETNHQGSTDSQKGSPTAATPPCSSGNTDVRPGAMSEPTAAYQRTRLNGDTQDSRVWTGGRTQDDIDIRPSTNLASSSKDYERLRDHVGTTGAIPDK